jgi:hypothetical protein
MTEINNVFLLHHSYGEPVSETYKLIGVFKTENTALNALNRAIKLPGFQDYPDGFSISCYVLDKCYWQDGFGEQELDNVLE